MHETNCTFCDGTGERMRPYVGPGSGQGMALGPCEYCGGTGKWKHEDEDVQATGRKAGAGIALVIGFVGILFAIGAFAIITSHSRTEMAVVQNDDMNRSGVPNPGARSQGASAGAIFPVSGAGFSLAVTQSPTNHSRRTILRTPPPLSNSTVPASVNAATNPEQPQSNPEPQRPIYIILPGNPAGQSADASQPSDTSAATTDTGGPAGESAANGATPTSDTSPASDSSAAPADSSAQPASAASAGN